MNDQNIKLILGFLFQLGAKVETVISKGSISFLDLPSFIGVFEAAGPALAAVKQLPAELSGLNDATIADVRAYIQSQLPSVIPNATVDGLINDGLVLIQELYDYAMALKAAKSQTPATPAASSAPAAS
jgi:hypothetical protein